MMNLPARSAAPALQHYTLTRIHRGGSWKATPQHHQSDHPRLNSPHPRMMTPLPIGVQRTLHLNGSAHKGDQQNRLQASHVRQLILLNNPPVTARAHYPSHRNEHRARTSLGKNNETNNYDTYPCAAAHSCCSMAPANINTTPVLRGQHYTQH